MTPRVVPFRAAPTDAADRERIAQSLDESLIVEASAGTGKTTALVERIANTLESGRARVQQIVAVTFTHKAAGELKLRLRQHLDHRLRRVEPPSRRILESALESLEEASVGTIHSFCAQILRERPVEADVDPLFVEAGPEEQRRLIDRAFRGWFEERLEAGSLTLQRALARRTAAGESPTGRLRSAAQMMVEWRDYDAPWQRPDWNREAQIDRLAQMVRDTAARINSSAAFDAVHTLDQWLRRAEDLGPRDYVQLESRLHELRLALRRTKARLDDLNFNLKQFAEASDADLAALLRAEFEGFLTRFEDLKRQAGMLDFQDQLFRARDLVRGHAAVRQYLQQRFTHFYIDEFQDTDPVQAELFLLLAADDPQETDWRRVRPQPGKLFLVGDPKQSIYKFRRADVRLYESICGQLEKAGVARLTLRQSFRAIQPIQQFVNMSFAEVMLGDIEKGQARYAPLEEVAPEIDGQPPLVFLDLPDPIDPARNRVSNERVEAALPGTIVRFVDWLIRESGWKVRGPGGELIPVGAEHVCLLFRKMAGSSGADLTRNFIVELERRGIPHVLAGSKYFHDREEVLTLRAALNAIEWPADTLHVYATLRGSLFAFRDEPLFAFTRRARLHPMADRPADPSPDETAIGEALDLLADLHRWRNRRPIAETINRLMDAVRAAGIFALRPGASQVLANLYRLIDQARSYEASGGISFRAFVEWIEEQATWTGAGDSPRTEEAAPGVRLMSVHSAKGLEFPIVILADLTTKIRHRDPERVVDPSRRLCAFELMHLTPLELLDAREAEEHREEAEGQRVAYVAATRARDLLVVPGLKGRRRWQWGPGGWFQALEGPMNAPEFLPFWRPPVEPGEEEAPAGMPLDLILQDGGEAAETVARQQQWQSHREQTLAAGQQPSVTILSPHRSPDPPPAGIDVEILTLPRRPDRPQGRRFGVLVHSALRFARPAEVRAAVELQARILGATGPEAEAAREAIETVFSHPLWQECLTADRILRETPLTLTLDDGRILDGVADLAYVRQGRWTVIDFKSGHDDPGGYVRQVAWYAYGLTRMTGQTARGIVLVI